ncbi:50S ribosomal protein L11 methyltransferase, partial [Neisseria dumasiana]|uniref:50S ribosomal protein L11 methyltransferase n=1 Tax=Neisseria dumasiana TaxID=1931275 RepID=UPI003F4DA91B
GICFMSYQQITIAVKDHSAERLADALMDHGALSAAIEDASAGTANVQAIFGEPGMPAEQIWQQSKVIALSGEHTDVAPIVAAAAPHSRPNLNFYVTQLCGPHEFVRLYPLPLLPI